MDPENTPTLGVSSNEGLDSDTIDSFREEQRLDFSSTPNEGSLGNSDSVSQSVDSDGDTDIHGSVEVHCKNSEPYFLRRVLRDELGEDGDDHRHRLLVIAVHAVMLESGFVGIDPLTGVCGDRFCLRQQWPSTAFPLSLHYSLPELLAGVGDMPGGVFLKFQSLGHFTIVYGFLAKGKSSFHGVRLDEHRFGPVINLMWEKNEKNAEKKETHGSSCSCPGKEVFEFWKIVKDDLVLPLLIDLTERVGLPLPSCFLCLPAELKLKIFESLTGVDLARVGCVSSELRYLADNNDLWKRMYADEFGEPVEDEIQGSVNWKQRFAWSWEAENLAFSWLDMHPLFLLPSRYRARSLRDDSDVWERLTQVRIDAGPIVPRSYRGPNWEDEAQVLWVNPGHRMVRTLGLDSRGPRPNIWVPTEQPPVNAGPNRPSSRGLDSRGASARRAPKNFSRGSTSYVPKNCSYRRKGKHR